MLNNIVDILRRVVLLKISLDFTILDYSRHRTNVEFLFFPLKKYAYRPIKYKNLADIMIFYLLV